MINSRIGIYLLITLVFLFNCRKPLDRIEAKQDKKDNSLSALVVFSIGDSRIIHADLTEEKAVLGSAFKTGDKIITSTKSKVDIQIKEGTAIRLGPNSRLEFTQLLQNTKTNSETKLLLRDGKVFVKVDKANKNDTFDVLTPTLTAGVRGTSFILEIKNEDLAMIKVIEGSVSVSQRVPSFEKIPLEEIEKNAGLKKLKEVLNASEVILEKEQQVGLPAKEKILQFEKLNNKNIKEIVEKISESSFQKPELAEITKTELQEIKTIVSVDPKITKEMIRLNEDLSSGRIDEAKAEELEQRRTALENQVSSKQEVEKAKFNESVVVEPKRLQSNREIVKYYERIEKIILVNGKVEIGAIINQEDSIMIIHTENGIIRVNTDDIVEVVYDFQTKYRF